LVFIFIKWRAAIPEEEIRLEILKPGKSYWMIEFRMMNNEELQLFKIQNSTFKTHNKRESRSSVG
jgi:hypothetical protein